MNVEFNKDESNTVKALMHLVTMAYGMDSGTNRYGLNVAACALALVAKLDAAALLAKPELVKAPATEPIEAA